MTSPRGEHVGAVYGFVRDMLQLIEQKKPDALICAFDLPGPTFRDADLRRYKADRGEMPEELVGQIPKIEQVLDALAIPVISCPGYEADDVLATIARICDEARRQVLHRHRRQGLPATDHRPRRRLQHPQGRGVRRGRAARRLGRRPDQVVDFQALVGDKVDNVPGVPGIGPKTAQQLLEKYGTLDNLLAHAAEIPGAKGKKLVEGREMALLSRQLVRLDTHVPIVPDWDAGRVGGFDHERARRTVRRVRLPLVRRARRQISPAGATSAASTASDANYQIVDTPAKLAELVAELAEAVAD